MIKKEHSRKIVSYLAGLSDETYDVFMEFAIIKEYPKGKILIEHGKKNEFVFFLISGSAKSYNFKDSKQICLWFAFESDCIATIRSLDDLISQETVELLEDSEFATKMGKEGAKFVKQEFNWEKVTKNFPKPMLEIGDKPLLQINVEILDFLRIDRVYVNTYFKSEIVELFIEGNSNLNKKVTLINPNFSKTFFFTNLLSFFKCCQFIF